MGKNHLPTQGRAPLLWSGRIPRATGQLSLGASTTAPLCLESALAVRGRCSERSLLTARRGAPAYHNQRKPAHRATRNTHSTLERGRGASVQQLVLIDTQGEALSPRMLHCGTTCVPHHRSPLSHHGRPCGQSLPCSSRPASSTTPRQPWSRNQLVSLQPLVPRQPWPVASLRKRHGLGACTSPRGMPPPQLPPVKTRTIPTEASADNRGTRNSNHHSDSSLPLP